jgi:hypothetical protein
MFFFFCLVFVKAISGMSDYVLSNDTVSKVLAMVAESREVKTVLRELLGSQGCDIHVHPVQRYLKLMDKKSSDDDENDDLINKYSYWDLFSRTRMRNEILLGWIRNEVLVLNPKGDRRDQLFSWTSDDTLVVLSESRGIEGGSRTRS